MKFLLDPGHGGMAFGHYLTPGKRSPEIPPGFYEGDVNRKICQLITNHRASNYEVLTIAPGPINIPLAARVKFVNQLYQKEKRKSPLKHKLEPKIALISIHCNAAAQPGWSAANGFVVFKPRVSTEKHDLLANLLYTHYDGLDLFYNRGIKEANFTMIRRPICPAVLLELGFMTNKEDVRKLTDPLTQIRIAGAISDAMREYADSVI